MKIRIILVFLLFLVILPSVIAYDGKFTVSLDCYGESCKDKIITNPEKDIILEFTITNTFDDLIKLSNNNVYYMSVDIESNNDNLRNINNDNKDFERHDILSNIYYFAPDTTTKIHFPFEVYNNQDKNKRVGDWVVNYEFKFGSCEFYEIPLNPKQYTSPDYNCKKIGKPLKGNPLKFTIVNPEAELSSIEKMKDNKVIAWLFGTMFGILTMVLVAVISGWILLKIGKK